MAIVLTIDVPDIATVLQSFNTIRVKRSIDGENGTYSLITSNAPVAATLLAPNAANYNVVGKTLAIVRDLQAQVNVVFTGSDPLTVDQVIAQINSAVGATIAFNESNKLRLTSTITGTQSKLEIKDGNAAVVFGWTPNVTRDIGEDAHVSLQAGVTSYTYTDRDGQAGYFYKAQFYNTTVNLESADSAPFKGDEGPKLDADEMCLVKVDLVDGGGFAAKEMEIVFYPDHSPDLVIDGYQAGLVREGITIKTDNNGHAETKLIRGMRYKVVYLGTSVIRHVTIPELSEVKLEDLVSTSPDPFSIKTLPFPAAPRRTV